MKRILLTPFIVGLLLSAVCPTYAQVGERLYPIAELTDADLAVIDLKDGSVEEWIDLLGEPTLTGIEFFTPPGGASYDPADMDFRLWIAWHDATNRIYAAMERADDIYVNTFDRSSHNWSQGSAFTWYQDSSINLMVDGDHSGGPYGGPCCSTDEDAFRFAEQAQIYVAIGETNGDPYVNIDVLQNLNPGYEYGDWYILPPYADGGGGRFSENPIITTTEFYVTPFDRLRWDSEEESRVSELSRGRIIGLRIVIIDRDSEEEIVSTSFTLPDPGSLTSEQRNSADYFFDGLLLGPGGAFPEEEDTAVENDSWGRIKASFR